MTLPLCAWCGESITGPALRARKDGAISIDHTRRPFRPRYGWHNDCAKLDPLGPFDPRDHMERLLAELPKRGPGRLLLRKTRWP